MESVVGGIVVRRDGNERGSGGIYTSDGINFRSIGWGGVRYMYKQVGTKVSLV